MLTEDELKSLLAAFGATCQFVTNLRARFPIARFVQYPKIPTVLSESLAVHAIRRGHLLASAGPFASVTRGGREGDIIAACEDGRRLKVETKASVASAWEGELQRAEIDLTALLNGHLPLCRQAL